MSAPRLPELYPARKRCRICNDVSRQAFVDAQLAKGLSAPTVSKLCAEINLPTTPQVIISHRKHYVAPITVSAGKEDLARLIRDRVVQGVKSGALEPTVSHGLEAQRLLDAREAKTTDKEMLVTLGRLLSGAMPPAGFLPPPSLVVIDGTAEEVEAK